MSISNNCRVAIKNELKDISDEEIDQIVRNIQSRSASNKRARAIDADFDNDLAAMKEVVSEEERATQIALRQRYINASRQKDRYTHYHSKPGAEIEALADIQRRVESLQRAEKAELVTPLVAELERTGLDKFIGKMSRDDYEGLWREMAIATGAKNETPTGNKRLEELGKLYADLLTNARIRGNSYGKHTRNLEGFVVARNYEPRRIAKIGYEQFKEDFLKTFKNERTFADIEDTPEAIDKFVRDKFTSMSTGVHMHQNEADWLGGFTGGSQNIAKAAAQERSLHANSAKAEFEFMEKYGNANINETVISTLMQAGRDNGLMRYWGTNPGAAYEADLRYLKKLAFDRNDENQLKLLNGGTISARHTLSKMAQLDGSADNGGHATAASIFRNWRGFESVVKLTGGVASSFPDMPLRAATLTPYQSLAKGYATGLQALGHGRGTLEERQLLARSGAVAEGVIGDFASFFHVGESLDGFMGKLLNLQMKLNGQTWWTRTLLNQSIKDLSVGLGFMREKSWADLDHKARTDMTRHGLTEADWDHARRNTVEDSSGRPHLLSDTINEADDATVRKVMGKPEATDRDIADFKRDHTMRWKGFFASVAEESMTTPDAGVRSISTFGGAPGTLAGEAGRMLTQFKSYPVAVVTQHLNRMLFRYGEPQYAQIGHLILAMTMMGYISGATKDVLRNRTPKVPENATEFAKILADSFVRGGSFGILADVAFNDWTKSGTASAAGLLGPGIGSAAEAFGLMQSVINTTTGVENSNLASKSIQFVSNHTPFVNLFYIKGAYEYTALHAAQEWANPGYIGRTQRRMEREGSQTYIIPPMW